MKVLFVMEFSIPTEIGCAVRNKDIMENMKQMGMEVLGLTSPFMTRPPGEPIDGIEVINGISYHRSQYLNTIRGISSPVLRWGRRIPIFKRYCKLLETICLQEKPDILHAITSFFNGNAANIVGRKLNIPRLYEVRSLAGSAHAVTHGQSYDSLKYKIPWMFDRQAMLGATRVAPLSRVLRNELTKRGIPAQKMDVVDNCVDTDKLAPQERSLEVVERYNLNHSTIVGYIGSIRKLEGLSILFHAAPQILEQCPTVKFMIVGDGEDRVNLMNLSRQKGLENSFIFPGSIPHNEISKYYSVIDIFAIPRVDSIVNHTVTPLKPLEVMATENVVLASDVGGLADLIQNGKTGVLFKAEDVDDFTAKIVELIQDRRKGITIGKEARDWVVNNRRLQDMVEKQYLPIYEKLLGRVAIA